MKILVLCSGSWMHDNVMTGLNSPERGEGRWAQQYARMLARAGHDVYAASGGLAHPVKEDGVLLIDQNTCKQYEPYDLFISPTWWEGKIPEAKAKKYIALKWSVESYMREQNFPDDMFFAYPYPTHHFEWTRFKNAHKSFALPTMFGNHFEKPKWNNSNYIFLPGKIDTNRDWRRYLPVMTNIFHKNSLRGVSKAFFQDLFDSGINTDGLKDKMLYNEVLNTMRQCKINMPILNPGCIIEATFQGLPSIFWEHGGFFNPLGESLDILIKHNDPEERLQEVFDLLITNKKKYHEVVRTSQDYFSSYTFEGSKRYFNLMMENIL